MPFQPTQLTSEYIRGIVYNAVEKGVGFVATKRFESVANDGSVEFVLVLSDDATKDATLILVEITATGKAWVDTYKNSTITSNGTEMPIQNLKISSSTTSEMKAYYGGSYTPPSGKFMEYLIPGGTRVFSIGSAVAVGEVVLLKRGSNLHFKITNKSGTTADIGVKILWIESVLAV